MRLCPPYRPKPDISKEDLRILQGAWIKVSVTIQGKQRTMPPHLTVVTFNNDNQSTGSKEGPWIIKLNTMNRLKWIDGFRVQGHPPLNRYFGIYRLDGDTFTICLRNGETDAVRRTGFDPTQPGVYVHTY